MTEAEIRYVAAQVVERLEGAEIVLLGEATHGTHEFYAIRAEATKLLVAEHGFRGLALEADWPTAARVNRYVKGAGPDPDAEQALGDFTRFPIWMWRNHVFVELVEWLRADGGRAGVYGLDLYSLRESMEAVIDYLDEVDPEAAGRARERYACFDRFDPQEYGLAAAGGREDCEDAVVEQLVELRERAAELAAKDGALPEDAHFAAQRNAALAAEAERYYRMMFRGRGSTWNLRDTHMADTLDALREHLGGGRIVVWAHNSHLGDARATSMGRSRDEVNLGQLARERHGDAVRIVGFTTFGGTVTAAREWGWPAELRGLAPGLERSVERRLHESGDEFAVLDSSSMPAGDLLQRMVGVLYLPQSERVSHYVSARASEQFDLLVHVDRTTALEPLERWSDEEEAPDTWPSGV